MADKGILDQRILPDPQFNELWERIVLPEEQKNRLRSQVLLELVVRAKLANKAAIPLHGIILLVGPPGTGKTSIAKGVASAAAEVLEGQQITFIEIEPHGLTSSALGKSQREVRKFLEEVVVENASKGPLIVLLDEVETLVSDRAKMSMEANPIDVHRATDAMLAGLDNLAARFPQLVFIATSNFQGALDPAFVSRADLILNIDKPTAEACEIILTDTLNALGEQWKDLKKLSHQAGFKSIVKSAVGLDGRQIRKTVLSACTYDVKTVLDPNKLTIENLKQAFVSVKNNEV